MSNYYTVKMDDGHDYHYIESVEATTEDEAMSNARWVAQRRHGKIARNWRPIEVMADAWEREHKE